MRSTRPDTGISLDKSFPPFHFYEDNGQAVGQDRKAKGMAADYIRLLFKHLDVTLKEVGPLPWTDVLDKAAARELDLIACAAKTPKREKYLSYTTAHLSFPLVIITVRDAPFVSSEDDLVGRKVALVRGISTYAWLENDNIKVVPLWVGSPLEALQAVALGKADAAVKNLALASHLFDSQGLTNLKIAAPTSYGNYDLAIGIRSDWPELVSILNKGLATLTSDTHSQIRQQWIAVRYEHGIRSVDVLRWVLLVAAVCGVIILAILYSNRRLQKEIAVHRRTDEELTIYHHIVSASRERMSFVAPDHTYRAVNKTYLEDFQKKSSDVIGRSVAEILGRETYDEVVRDKLDAALAGEEIHYESQFTVAGNDTRFMEVAYYPFKEKDGSISGVVVNARDITVRKKTDKKLLKIQNLANNSRDALPEGGTIHLAGENCIINEEEIPSLHAGRYVKIIYSDKGQGIEPEILDRIFDPYFTTKVKGNGLGLATSYSIINKHHGLISVASEPGQGTSFTILLPASDESISQSVPEQTRADSYAELLDKVRIALG